MPETRTPAGAFALHYGLELEEEIAYLQGEIGRYPAIALKFPARWLAVKLLENDADLQQTLLPLAGGAAVLTHAQLAIARLQAITGQDVEAMLAERRYTWIHNLVQRTVHKQQTQTFTTSDKIDRVVAHPLLGIPIFMLAMWMVFKLTADVSAPYVDWIDATIGGPLTRWTIALLGALGAGGGWVESLLVNGVLAGVGGVLVFVPVLMALYLALAVLEDSGYMARAAFVMDRLMSKIGLHGKSFLPLLVGFGCNVPAIYATRTLENEKDRILTALLVPFMSCGARLPVYVLFATIFFGARAGTVIFGLYLLGIVTAIGLGLALRKTVLRSNEQAAFVMELPPYRLPTPRSIWLHMWQRTRAFLKHATTLILSASVVIWLLMAIPAGGDGRFAQTDLADSAFRAVTDSVTPLLAPLGFGTWEAGGALVTGFVAKEVVVSTLAQTYGVADVTDASEPVHFLRDLAAIGRGFVAATGDTLTALPLLIGVDLSGDEAETADSTLMAAIRRSFDASSGGYGALAALAFMVFVLIYTPCVVTLAAMRQELGNRWMLASTAGQLILAWLLALIVFQVGRLVV